MTEYTVEYTTDGVRRRIRYEPRADADGYWRIEEEHRGCRWATVGREPVEDVVAEGAEVV